MFQLEKSWSNVQDKQAVWWVDWLSGIGYCLLCILMKNSTCAGVCVSDFHIICARTPSRNKTSTVPSERALKYPVPATVTSWSTRTHSPTAACWRQSRYRHTHPYTADRASIHQKDITRTSFQQYRESGDLSELLACMKHFRSLMKEYTNSNICKFVENTKYTVLFKTSFFYVFEWSLLCSSRLHLFDKKYSKNCSIVKYYCNFK